MGVDVSQETSAISDTLRRIAYPSPFFDIARKYIPPNIKEVMIWTQYFYAISSIIHPIINKISEYPITDLIYNCSSEQRKTWEKILGQAIDIKSFMVELHQDYYIYGNGFAIFHEPFVRYLTCRQCGNKKQAKSLHYRIVTTAGTWNFEGKCPKCDVSTRYKVEDISVRNKSKAKLTRISPIHIEIEHNEFNGESHYIYKMPRTLRRAVLLSSKIVLDTLDKVIIDAIVANKDVQLDPDKIYHFKRSTIKSLWPAWGTPILLPVLKDIHYYYILRKANEALALQRIVPLMILFPQANADVSPFQHLNLSQWRAQVEEELARWRKDPNHIPVMPIPIGNQLIGGDARQMMVTQEQELVSKQIAAGIGVPIEFVQGGLNWSGSSVSLRVLENSFLKLRTHDLNFINNHLIPKLARIYRIPKITIKFKKFKMADDVQAKAQHMNLMQAGYVSRKAVLEQEGYDSEEEMAQMEKEHLMLNRIRSSDELANQEMMNIKQIMQTKNIVIAQHEGQELQKKIDEARKLDDKEEAKVKIDEMAEKYALTILTMEPQIAGEILKKMNTEMPNLHTLVMEKIKNVDGNMIKIPDQKPQAPVPVQESVPENNQPEIGDKTLKDEQTKSLPEQKPPRRESGGV